LNAVHCQDADGDERDNSLLDNSNDRSNSNGTGNSSNGTATIAATAKDETTEKNEVRERFLVILQNDYALSVVLVRKTRRMTHLELKSQLSTLSLA
jgi:hypothetical protein